MDTHTTSLAAPAPARAALSQATWVAVLGAPPLADEVAAELAALSTVQHASAGSLLASREQPALDLLVLAAGDAALGTTLATGDFRPERSLRAPDWLDANSAWLGGPHALDVRAVSDVTVLRIPRAVLLGALSRHPELARRLLAVLAAQVHALTLTAHDLMHKDAQARLASWLLHRCGDGTGSEPTTVALHERKRDIAAQLAIAPETLSRLLGTFSREGLIEVHGYAVRLLDPGALRARAA